MNNTGVTGLIYRPIPTLSMRVFGPRNSAYAFWPTTDTIYIYIKPMQPTFPLYCLCRTFMTGYIDPTQWLHKKMFSEFILLSPGRFKMTRYASHKLSEDDDINNGNES